MELDGFLSALFTGIVVGLLGRLVAPRSGNVGCLLTILLGIAGAAIGLWIGDQVVDGSFWLTLLMQVIAAALLVSVFAALSRRR